jgi:adenosylcobinamide kinase / adenosylcobinamide-phosphate guanylyltransferase
MSMAGEMVLVLGGARSGKSRFAASLAAGRPPVTYLATATVDMTDPEMVARVARHRSERPADWVTCEVPRELGTALTSLSGTGGSILVECVTLWVTNLILGLGGGLAMEDGEILGCLERAIESARSEARVIWVSNEVGWSVVPENPLARRFSDLQGWVNQRLAAASESVHLCVAGLPVRLK